VTINAQQLWERIWKALEIAAAIVAILSVVVSTVVYLREGPTRRKNAVFAAWQVVGSMEGKHGSGGREAAMAELVRQKERMSGLNIEGAYLFGLDLSATDLSGSRMAGARLTECDFSGATITGADLHGADIPNGVFLGAMFDSVNLCGVNFTDAKMTGASLRRVVGDGRTSFNGAHMRQVDLASSSLDGAVLDNAELSHGTVLNLHMCSARFTRANLDSTMWRWVIADSANFALASAKGAEFGIGSSFVGGRFDRAKLSECVFEGASLRGARFFRADLSNARFQRCDLRGVDASSAVFLNTTMQECRLDGMRLEGANREGLNLEGCSGVPWGGERR
jgi:uncharacterized protein YjbI with pentapeptide repeats